MVPIPGLRFLFQPNTLYIYICTHLSVIISSLSSSQSLGFFISLFCFFLSFVLFLSCCLSLFISLSLSAPPLIYHPIMCITKRQSSNMKRLSSNGIPLVVSLVDRRRLMGRNLPCEFCVQTWYKNFPYNLALIRHRTYSGIPWILLWAPTIVKTQKTP